MENTAIWTSWYEKQVSLIHAWSNEERKMPSLLLNHRIRRSQLFTHACWIRESSACTRSPILIARRIIRPPTIRWFLGLGRRHETMSGCNWIVSHLPWTNNPAAAFLLRIVLFRIMMAPMNEDGRPYRECKIQIFPVKKPRRVRAVVTFASYFNTRTWFLTSENEDAVLLSILPLSIIFPYRDNWYHWKYNADYSARPSWVPGVLEFFLTSSNIEFRSQLFLYDNTVGSC